MLIYEHKKLLMVDTGMYFQIGTYKLFCFLVLFLAGERQEIFQQNLMKIYRFGSEYLHEYLLCAGMCFIIICN